MAEESTTRIIGRRAAILPARSQRSRGRRKIVPVLEDENATVDYKDPAMLRYFVSDRGKLLPRRMTGATPKQQRQLAMAVKRARMIALMPFSAME